MKSAISTSTQMNLAVQEISGFLDRVQERQMAYRRLAAGRGRRVKREYALIQLSPEIKNKPIVQDR